MKQKYNQPVMLQIYLGSGKEAVKLKTSIEKEADISVSKMVVDSLRTTHPHLFRSEQNGSK